MRTKGLCAVFLVAPSVLGAALPKAMTGFEAQADEEFAELEARGLHASCILAMTTCLAGYGFANFKYQKTMIQDKYIRPWQICGSAAVFSGACQDHIGTAVTSEPGQMFQWHQENKLVEPVNCELYPCDDDDDCDRVGCAEDCTANLRCRVLIQI